MLETIIKSMKKSLLAVGFCAYAACGDTTIINNYIGNDGGSVQQDSSIEIQKDAGARKDAPQASDSYSPDMDGDARSRLDAMVDANYPDLNSDTGRRADATTNIYFSDGGADSVMDAAIDISSPDLSINPTYSPDALFFDVSVDVVSGIDVSANPALLDASTDTTDAETVINTSGRIVFRSERDGNYEICVMNADGSDPVNLSNNAAYDGRPRWSPDGTKIAFVSDRWYDGNIRLHVMENDGSNIVRLSNYGGTYSLGFSWSPRNSQIVYFSRNSEDCGGSIFVVNIDGSEETPVTGNTGDCSLENNPSWSPDGNKIVYEYQSGYNNRDIYSMNVGGRGGMNLTNGSAYNTNPQWSPDGSKIAFQRTIFGEEGTSDIYVMNPDGTDQVNVTNNYLDENSYSWSPDSRSIAYELNSGIGEDTEIHRITIEDLVTTRLTDSPGLDRQPRWSPDGSRIVFMSTRNGNAEIFTMDSTDGGNLQNLSNDTTYNDSFPDWSL